jgi:LigT-like phosphoesterase
MRLFTALALPDDIADGLSLIQGGVPGARWSTRDQLHLTLRFIGEVDGRVAHAVDDALALVREPSFRLTLKSVGQFGGIPTPFGQAWRQIPPSYICRGKSRVRFSVPVWGRRRASSRLTSRWRAYVGLLVPR